MSTKQRFLLLLIAVFYASGLAAQEAVNPFGFTGHEYDSESGLYYMKGRYYDPEAGRVISPDPAAGNLNIPMTLHPYIYALANPTVYVDPDGREVRVLDEQSLELIKSTLPVDLQDAVKVGDDNLLRKDALNAVETEDSNFLALRELANLSEVTAVQSNDRVRFINAEGAIVEEPFTFQTREQVINELVEQGVSREQLENEIPEGEDFLFLGLLATPRANGNEFDDQATVSLTDEATVTLPSDEVDAPEVEGSKTAAHEIFGHALLFQQGEKFEHGDVPGSVFREIEERTEQTFNSNITTVGENPDGPGVELKKGGGHENQR